MRVDRLWLTDFRNYHEAAVELAPRLTVVLGSNGEGKTNLLEAIGYVATLGSFRGVPTEALVRQGCDRGFVRVEGERAGRTVLVDVEIPTSGRGRATLNHQTLRRNRDLLGALRTSIFSPDDLALVKGGPGERRRWLDDALVALHPRHDATRGELERVLRQRNTLLRQAGGRLTAEVVDTLDVWDAKLVTAGEALGAARAELVGRAEPELAKAYSQIAGDRGPGAPRDVTMRYAPLWREQGLAAALAGVRDEEVRRGVSLVGPHRDDVELSVGGLPARTHASQGEQRSLALALRLAAHAVVAEAVGEPPVLLLDDVFSELDPGRAEALVAHLPAGQTVLTTAGSVPAWAEPALVLRIAAGQVVAADR